MAQGTRTSEQQAYLTNGWPTRQGQGTDFTGIGFHHGKSTKDAEDSPEDNFS